MSSDGADLLNPPEITHCFVCGSDNPSGLGLHVFRDGTDAVATWVPDERFQGWADRLHGGIIGLLVDEMLVYAGAPHGLWGMTAKVRYWLRKPGPNPDVVIAYQGAVAPEAIAAAGMIATGRRDVGVLSVTSADRLHADWTATQEARAQGANPSFAHIERLLADLPPHCTLVTVIDGHPATLSWLGGVMGHRVLPLGVTAFGQTGTIGDLYRHFGLDARSIADRVQSLTPGRRLCA